MFNQHAKWLKTTRTIPWRAPIASLNYVLSSHVWRQDHNGLSHQDPGFIGHPVTAVAALAPSGGPSIDVADAAALTVGEARDACGVGEAGLSAAEVAVRLARYGPNAVASHRTRPWAVLWHQLRSPLLGLLLVAAVLSSFLGERDDAIIIGAILAVSVGLGFVNELRAERAADALHRQIHHVSVVCRDGRAVRVDVTALVPGDLVTVGLGDVVPADLRLVAVVGLQCDESVLTGEAVPVDKGVDAVAPGTALAELTGCALMPPA